AADGARVFIAMELVDGETLGAWLRAATRPRRDIIDAFFDAGRGLAAAHAAGLVHRDFKPDNVLRGADGRVRVADFGLVAPSRIAARPGDDGRAPTGHALTTAGAVLGTPLYMAPEQHRGEIADARADQYAFCAALYEALLGRPPFAGTSSDELAAAKAA